MRVVAVRSDKNEYKISAAIDMRNLIMLISVRVNGIIRHT